VNSWLIHCRLNELSIKRIDCSCSLIHKTLLTTQTIAKTIIHRELLNARTENTKESIPKVAISQIY
jgi:hypothetical protein